jgi:hypothetical protein
MISWNTSVNKVADCRLEDFLFPFSQPSIQYTELEESLPLVIRRSEREHVCSLPSRIEVQNATLYLQVPSLGGTFAPRQFFSGNRKYSIDICTDKDGDLCVTSSVSERNEDIPRLKLIL